jgi:DNA-binding MarR family transcriptional regulator
MGSLSILAYGHVFVYPRGMGSDELVDALERIVAGSVGLTTRALADATPGYDLTLAQWRVLFILGAEPDGARVGTVAARVGVTLPATGRLLRRLERRGLATLAIDEVDRRATRVRLTDEGREVRTRVIGARRAMLHQLGVELDPVDRVRCAPLLDALAGALDRRYA